VMGASTPCTSEDAQAANRRLDPDHTNLIFAFATADAARSTEPVQIATSCAGTVVADLRL
jgi:hypothetical protein